MLQKYDFISASLQEYEEHATPEEFTDGVKDLQFMSGLAETGELNPETLVKISGRRCGNIDNVEQVRQRRADHLQWRGMGKTDLTWAITVYSSRDYSDANYIDNIRGAIEAAFSVWSSGTGLVFNEIMDPNKIHNADIRVSFHRGPHGDNAIFDGQGGKLAHGFYPGEELEGNIHLDDDEPWDLSLSLPANQEKTSLYLVMAHEIGHVLGLRHSYSTDSLMFAWYNENTTATPNLSQEDESILTQLYAEISEPQTTTIAEELTTPMGNDTEEQITCPNSVDAVLPTRDFLLFFKDQLYWSLDANLDSVVQRASIHTFWYGLPDGFTNIDAVYRRLAGDTPTIIFFSGKNYVEFTSNQRSDIVRPIVDFCLPTSVEKVDAVFVWGRNRKTYIIVGDMYWKFDELISKTNCSAVSGYPRSVRRIWRGVPLPVDSAFTSFDDHTYFFRGENYWKFNNRKMRVVENSQSPGKISNLLHCEVIVTNSLLSDSTTSDPGNAACQQSWLTSGLLAIIYLLHTIMS